MDADQPACYRICTARVEAGWGDMCIACDAYVTGIANSVRQRSRERAERYLREMGEERVEPEEREARRQREEEDGKKREEEKKNCIEEAVKIDLQRDSLELAYDHACPICCMKNPLKRVAFTCGHIVCEPCAEKQKMSMGQICLICRKRCPFFRLYEHDGVQEEEKPAHSVTLTGERAREMKRSSLNHGSPSDEAKENDQPARKRRKAEKLSGASV